MSFEHDDLLAVIPRLRAYARSLAQNGHVADDLVQDTVVSALQARDQFRSGTNLRAWMFTILRNRFLSLMTRRPRSIELPVDDRDHADARWWTPAAQESGIEVAAFMGAFRTLSPRHREVLVLVGVHGMRYDEVAQICGCEVGTVKSRVCRAREQLKSMLFLEEDRSESSASSAVKRSNNIPSSLPPQKCRNHFRSSAFT